ncbi:MAG: hypothetical protein C0490_02315 [Marivirga sp.]|nr:hypothetical protein [Marivirga sp.]
MLQATFNKALILSFFVVFSAQRVSGTDFYVSPTGSDSGNGSKGSPWKTLQHASVSISSKGSHTIHLAPGTYIEKRVTIPPGISVAGAGKDLTIIKAHATVNYNPVNPGFGVDKFLINLVSRELKEGNQTIKNITIDGDGKKLHGGIYLENRSHVIVENIKVQSVNFCGVWLMSMRNSAVKGLDLKDCAWGSTAWCSGALQVSNSQNIDISGFNIDEGKGYGIKNLGQTQNTSFAGIKIHDGRISVSPKSLWNKGTAPNISIEIWASSYPGTEIFNCYVDNHISLVNYPVIKRTTPIKIYNNVFDILGPRAKGDGYCIELSIHDAEIYHNWFNGGSIAIVNWGDRQYQNWNIHHNTFYGMSSIYPTAIITSYKGGLKDIYIYNNTAETSGTATVNFIEFNNGGVSENIVIKNNLIINSNTKYAHYPNRFISLENGAIIKNLQVSHNLLYNLPIGKVSGSYSNNLSASPILSKSGSRPKPYYVPMADSPVIDAGINVGLSFKGKAPDIGAYEVK